MSSSCPLCGSHEISATESIQYSDLRAIYKRQFGLEIQASSSPTLQLCRCARCDLRFFTPAVVGEGELYVELQKYPWYYLEEKDEFKSAARRIQPGSTTLEIGSGAGFFARHLPEGVSYRGLEYNDAAIAKATARGLDVRKQSMADLASEGYQADVVCSFQVLEHVPSPGEFLREMTALLRPGGLLIVSVPSEDSLMEYEVNAVLNMPPHHQTRWTDRCLKSLPGYLPVDLVDLAHEPVDPLNAPGLAKAQLFRLLGRARGRKFPLVSPAAESVPARALAKLASLPFRLSALRPGRGQFGHTVTAIYRKREAG